MTRRKMVFISWVIGHPQLLVHYEYMRQTPQKLQKPKNKNTFPKYAHIMSIRFI